MILSGYKTKMNNPDTDKRSTLRAEVHQQRRVDSMVESLQDAAAAERKAGAYAKVASAFERSVKRTAGNPVQAYAQEQEAHYLTKRDDSALEAMEHNMKVDEIAMELGEKAVEEVTPRPRQDLPKVPAVIDLR